MLAARGIVLALGAAFWKNRGMTSSHAGGSATSPGRARLIAANGDNIFTTSAGVTIPTADPNVSNIVEAYTLTGGTGQYAGAKDSFTVNRVITVENQEVLFGTTSGSFNGSIIVRGNPH